MSLLYDQVYLKVPRARILYGDSIPSSPEEWLCSGSSYLRVTSPTLKLSLNLLFEAAATINRGIYMERWVRYRARLSDATSTIADPPVLVPVTDEIITHLREHPDARHNQLQSGLRFWDHGLRRAYIWLVPEGPLCIQWLLTAADNDKLRTLPTWAGMYPPLAPGCGQVENLFAFPNVRRRGVATQFAYGMYAKAREAGLRQLITHIHEDNDPACGWATRTGWTPYGTITQYQFAWPILRGQRIFLHWAYTARPTSSSVRHETTVQTPA